MHSAEEVVGMLNGINASAFSPAEIARIQRALLKALRRVQSPFDIAMDQAWGEPATVAFVKILIDADFWKGWVAAGGQPSSFHELSALTTIDPAFLERMIRFLAAQEIVDDVKGDGSVYELTDFGRALAGPLFPETYSFHQHVLSPSFANFPTFAAKTNYKNPEDQTYTNVQDWWEKGPLFALLASDPRIGQAFNRTMTVFASTKVPWVDIYPTESIISNANAETGHVLVVDIAGGLGHDIERFRAKHPEVAQRLVLQDVPAVIAQANVKSPIEKQEIDMFQEQPIHGARVYMLKTVLHDWTDAKAVEILKVVKRAMTPGYSRILLYETIISEKATKASVTLDVTMMVLLSGKERTKQMWETLVDDAGLRIVKIWNPEGNESIIEIERPE